MVFRVNKSTSLLFCVLLVLTAIIVFTPLLIIGILFMLLCVVFIAIALSNKSIRYSLIKSRILLYTLLYICLCVLYKVIGISGISPGRLVFHLFYFVCTLIMLLQSTLITSRQNKILFYVLAFVLLINIIENIRLCIVYPEVALLVNRARDSDIKGINIGGALFYDQVMFFYSICLFGFLECKERVMKSFLLISIVVSLVFIFGFCVKASVLVLTVVYTYLIYFSRKAISLPKFIIKSVLPAMLLIILVNIYSDLILEQMSQLFSDSRLNSRLAMLIAPDSETAISGNATMSAREDLWMLSINTWTDNINNIIFGIGDQRADWDTQTASNVGIGLHSDFFDSFARYGLTGMALLFPIHVLSFKYLKLNFGKKYRMQLFAIFLLFIMQCVTKTVFNPGLGFLLFVFLLFLARILKNQNDGDQTNSLSMKTKRKFISHNLFLT